MLSAWLVPRSRCRSAARRRDRTSTAPPAVFHLPFPPFFNFISANLRLRRTRHSVPAAPGRATPSNHFLAATQAASTSSIHQPPFSGALSPLLPPHDSAPRRRTGRRPLWTGTIARRPHRSRHATASVDSARRISLSPLRIPPWRPHLGGAEGSYWLHHSHAHALRGRPSLG